MKCFVRKLFDKELDEKVHSQFVRFGKGKYEKRALMKLQKSTGIKAKGSFEYANDFVVLVSELVGEMNISGKIFAKKNINELIGELGKEGKKGELLMYEVQGKVNSERLREIGENSYFTLLDIEAPGINLKIKKNLPKPGKGGGAKMDYKFCELEADLKFWPKIKEAFYWNIEGKKAEVSHDFIINDLILPKDEKDFAKIRLLTKRKGKLTRKEIVDGAEKIIECEFEA